MHHSAMVEPPRGYDYRMHSNEEDQGPAATPNETRNALLRAQTRGYTQVRGLLVQLPEDDQNGKRSSTLATFVHNRRHRALLLYLLLLGAWPGLEDSEEPLAAGVWIRALTSSKKGALTWSDSALSRAWRDLVEMGLVVRERRARLVRVTPRREDGQAAYTRPSGRADHDETYFVLPDGFWQDDLFGELSLPGLAMLLFFLRETNGKPEAKYTFDQIEQWYGIARRTAQKGVQELLAANLLHARKETVPAPLSATGKTTHIHYSLTGKYGHDTRADLRKQAREARDERQSNTTKKKPRRTRLPQHRKKEGSA